MCSICLDSFCEINNNVLTTCCNHRFHKECFKECVRYGIKECPICRRDIESDISKYSFEVKVVDPVIQIVSNDSEIDDNRSRYMEPSKIDWFHFIIKFGFRGNKIH
jgi:hypothetical protein